jgi:hypothetical protein
VRSADRRTLTPEEIQRELAQILAEASQGTESAPTQQRGGAPGRQDGDDA